MRIKNIGSNQYLLVNSNIWIRNFCNENVKKIDLNSFSEKDCTLFLENELMNHIHSKKNWVQNSFEKVVIVSDGYDFESKHKILADLPNDVKIIAVNRTLKKWQLVGKNATQKRAINLYVVNNPYEECMAYLPEQHKYYPPCLSSTRTNHKFINRYSGEVFYYKPVPDRFYSGRNVDLDLVLDDYRNPICAALCYAYKFGAKEILLLCCDDSFKDNKPGSVRLENNLYTYQVQIEAQNIIDGCLYWLKQNNINIFHHSYGVNYQNGKYIDLDCIKDVLK